MTIPPFKLEEYWKKYEFTAPYILCSSDTENWKMHEVLAMADTEMKKLWENLSLSYTESSGHPILREEIAKLYPGMSKDQVITFAGAEEGIYCTMRALIKPSDHVIVIDPCYQSLKTLPEAVGAEITSIRLHPHNEWKLQLEDVQKAFRKNTKLLVLNFPHNPTGQLLEPHVFHGLVELARKSNAYIFCDEVYRFLEIDPEKRLPSFANVYEKGISLNVMTKSFGLAGLRIGWLASKDEQIVHDVGSYKLYASICNSAPSEILAIIALRAKEKILKRNRDIMLSNLKILDSFMKRHEKIFSWIPPQSGPMALIKLSTTTPIEKFAEELVQKAGILIMPGSIFDLPGNYFRIGFGKKSMPEILDRLDTFLKT